MFFTLAFESFVIYLCGNWSKPSSNSGAQSAKGLRGRKKARGTRKESAFHPHPLLPPPPPPLLLSAVAPDWRQSKEEKRKKKKLFLYDQEEGDFAKKRKLNCKASFFWATSIATRLWQNTVLRFFYRNFTGGIAHSWGERKSTFAIRFFSPPSYILTKCGGLFWVLGFGVFFRSGDQPVFSAVTTKPKRLLFPRSSGKKKYIFCRRLLSPLVKRSKRHRFPSPSQHLNKKENPTHYGEKRRVSHVSKRRLLEYKCYLWIQETPCVVVKSAFQGLANFRRERRRSLSPSPAQNFYPSVLFLVYGDPSIHGSGARRVHSILLPSKPNPWRSLI